jgi:hypothetical protein
MNTVDSSKTPWLRLIVWATVIGLLCGVVVGIIAERATSAPPDDVPRVPGTTAYQCAPEFDCPPPVLKAQRDWEAGRFGGTRGFTPRRWFKTPVLTNRLIVRRIDRWLNNHPRRARIITRIYRRGTPAFTRSCGSTYGTCLYWDNVSSARCVGNGGYVPYPASASSTQCQKHLPRNNKLTNRQVKAAIVFSGCSAAGAFGFVVALKKPGRPWSALIAGGLAQGTCFLGAWVLLTS